MSIQKLRPVLSLLLVAMMGCGGGGEAPAGGGRVSPESATGKGVVRGRITLAGTPPEMKLIRNQPCHENAHPIREEYAVVDATGGLKNVVVSLEGGPRVDGTGLKPALLDQVDCRYVPHVVGVVVNQQLVIRSSDDAFHNTHYVPSKNAAGNFSLLKPGQEKEVRFAQAETFPVKCDVHPWMLAYVCVMENQHFAVTDEGGKFEIAGVPPGKYTLVTWHELYGAMRQPVEISDSAPIVLDMVYKP